MSPYYTRMFVYKGVRYPCVADAYKAQHIPEADTQKRIETMKSIVCQLYRQHKDLQKLLMDKRFTEIRPRNTAHENFWGSCKCDKCKDMGDNYYGRILYTMSSMFANERRVRNKRKATQKRWIEEGNTEQAELIDFS